MRIGVLTSGGDCPGLNAVIRSVVHRGVVDHGDEIIGFQDGWRGLLEGDYRELTLDSVSGILAQGGTILGSTRVQPSHLRNGWPGPRSTARNSASTASSRSAARAP
jgi:6-phosphofructokinase